jgi:hypothetical protein
MVMYERSVLSSILFIHFQQAAFWSYATLERLGAGSATDENYWQIARSLFTSLVLINKEGLQFIPNNLKKQKIELLS